ncbi:MAG: Imm27 family immunity protein [Steroidobacteraceae bacterium]
MNKLDASERDLVGAWIVSSEGFRADETCARIEWLVREVLQQVAVSPQWGAWQTLFRDPADGRLWERTYPEGERQGGGPPRLTNISLDDAVARYGVEVVR